jgi:hypothetical protein
MSPKPGRNLIQHLDIGILLDQDSIMPDFPVLSGTVLGDGYNQEFVAVVPNKSLQEAQAK